MPKQIRIKKVALNGRRAVAGKFGVEKTVSEGKLKEENQKLEFQNQIHNIAYRKKENIQIENKEEKKE